MVLSPQALFGHYLDEDGIINLKAYSYTSCGSTFIDRLFNYWWNFVVQYLTPRTISPNLLTLIGFCGILLASALMFFLNPTLDQPMPRWMYFLLFTAIFVYQTLDAIDGKQARRTKSSSPLGQLFDHGCDTFTTVLVPLMAVSVVRLGCGWAALAVVSVLQIQLFIFCWWDLHFHIFPHSGRLGLGCTEGQLAVMLICLFGGIFGADAYVTPITPDHWKQLPLVVYKLLPPWLTTSTFTAATPVFIFAISLLGFVSVADIPFGLRSVKNKPLASAQLFACLLHVGCQVLFFFSSAVQMFPPWGLCLMTAASSAIAIRIELSAVGKSYFSPLLWPVYPIDLAGIVLFFLGGSQPQWVDILILSLLTLWFAIYLGDLISTSIDDISRALGIYCFSIEKRKEMSSKVEPITPEKHQRPTSSTTRHRGTKSLPNDKQSDKRSKYHN